MRKILFVHDGPIYRSSNGDYYGIHLSDALIERYKYLGDKVDFLMRVENIGSNVLGKSKINSSSFEVIAVPNFKSIRLYLFNYWKAYRIISNTVSKYDIIICRQPSAIGTIAAYTALKLKKPLLTEFVACTYDAYMNYGWRGKLIAYYKLKNQQSLVKKLSHIIYVTKHFLQNRYPSKANQINCSNVIIDFLQDSHLRDRLDKIRTMTSDHIKIATVGALNMKYKGQIDVIKALARLKKDRMQFHYFLVGQGNSDEIRKIILEEGLQDSVTIVGSLEHHKVIDFLLDIDIYIQPSRTEGLPRATIEAMSVACPILAADVGGLPELIDSDFLFKPGDVSQIAIKLTSFSKEKMLEQATVNFAKVKDYQKDVLDERRQAFYDQFLKQQAT